MSKVNPDCERCRGTGLVTITIGGDGYGNRCCGTMDCDDQPCPLCSEDEPIDATGHEQVATPEGFS